MRLAPSGGRHRVLPAAVALSLASPALAAPAATLEFSDGFLLGGQAIDMARYANGNPVAAGVHAVDVYVNDQFLQSRDLRFEPGPDPHIAQPCLPLDLLQLLPLKAQYLQALQARSGCVDLAAQVDGATVAFDSGTLRLAITVPQAAQSQAARGYVAPAQRDAGIAAAFIDYSANHQRSNGTDSSYLGVHAGLNVGGWRLRHRTSFSRTDVGTRQNVINSQLQHDLPGWNSQLLLGQGHTGGELFDSVAFTGVRVASDERMLPDSLRGFAPVVRGIAESNARVSIVQNGVLIHEVNVQPGPFSIEDLYPTNFGGDLQVTVTEADGRQQQFTVNFSAVPQALRAGASRLSATAGQLRDTGLAIESLRFAEGTYARGISNHLTLLGGAQIAQHYHAVLAGAAVNTRVGAFGADIAHSRARLPGQAVTAGNSYRLNYQRYVARTGSNFGLAAYRYSTQGFLSLHDAARSQADDWGAVGRARQRYQVNFTQRMGARSSLHLSGGHVAYWDSTRRQNDFQLGFQSVAGRVNYGLSAQRYRLGDGTLDTRYAFTLSVPLGRADTAPRLSSQVSHADSGSQTQVGVNGVLGERRALSYGLSASTASGDAATRSHGAYASYLGPRAHLNASYSRLGRFRSQSVGASGSLVLHGSGLLAGPPVGEGFALVHAAGAEGAQVGGAADVRIGRNGYALLPHVSPYRWNRIELDPSGLPMEVELMRTSYQVAPTAGSIVRVPFEVRRQRTLFIDATDALGQPLPFAAEVTTASGAPAGAVGQGGVIQLRGADDRGELLIDPAGTHACRLQYQMPNAPDSYGLYWTHARCQPLATGLPSTSERIP